MRSASLQFPGMLSTRVLGNLLTDNAFLGIAAVGMTFVILSGGIDLSVGSVIGFTGVLDRRARSAGRHASAGSPSPSCWSSPPLFGAAMGAAIHYLQVPPFIVTLAGMFLARGVASVLVAAIRSPINHDFYDDDLRTLYLALPGGGRLTLRSAC